MVEKKCPNGRKERMKRTLKGMNSTGGDCVLEITDAGKKGLVWLNIDYFNNPPKQHIVVDVLGLRESLSDLEKADLI